MPERKLLCLSLLLSPILLFSSLTRAESPFPHKNHPAPSPGTYIRTEDGLIVYPDPLLSGNTGSVKLQVVADNIIRVLSGPNAAILSEPNPASLSGANPAPAIDPEKSLITVYATDPSVQWDIKNEKNTVVLTTRLLNATVTIATGAVTFTDRTGAAILSEKTNGGRSFEPAIFDGETSWHIRQTFTTRPDEAIYGLGQHQDGLINYKGKQTSLFQNNSEVAIPFLLSNKNYGILWDNYSLTDIGDIRPYKPLSAMKLFSRTGEQGWLTTTYNNDKQHPGQADFEQAGSDINYAYLGDSKKLLPAEFRPAKGSVTWQGSLASEFTGQHVFHFTFGGYIKVWIDGKLLLDRWRQAWNPASALLDIPMEKDRKYAIKIEWIPDGEESYCSLKWLDPIPPAQKNDFSFLSEAGKQLDYYFIYGANMDEVIAGYRHITGKSTIAPKWAMGLWQSRERYKTQNEILNTVKEFRARRIPLDNIVLDWSYWQQDAWGSQEFDARRFPSPDSMIRVLHNDYHTHFMISVWPKFYEGISTYQQFNQKNWLYKRNIADNQRDWIGQGYVSTFYDAFNKDARKGFWDLLNNKLYNKGIDAWWMDASEPDILSNVSPEKRKAQMTPTAMGAAAEYLNAYPLENAKGIYEGQRSVNPDQRVFILTRSAFAGSQHYGAAVWSGDIAANWSDMRNQIAAGISFSMSGIPYWSMDIGGFAVEHRYEHAQGEELEEWREQMTRWYQFGAFCPLFRVHGQFPYREIYNVAPDNHPAYASMLYYDRLRYRLLPYIYSLSGMTWQKDYTIMRGLVMDFEKDTAVNNIADEYLLGPSLLVAPVTGYHERSHEVYLPAGQGWYDLYSGKYTEGAQRIKADAPYERMPVFVKEGSILPFGPALQYTSEKQADTITLFVYTGRDARFTLYEDEGTNYNYEKGAYANIPFVYDELTGTLTIGRREGSFTGMLPKRTFNIIRITKDRPAALEFERPSGQIVHYEGKQKSIHLK
ncbi:MAG TPA: TIM-barrel domain-containing protein [Puia sp.]|nr:TIM-barrel domain-containing protein [Puia sp.]